MAPIPVRRRASSAEVEVQEILDLLALRDEAQFLRMGEADDHLVARAAQLGGEQFITTPNSPSRTRQVLYLLSSCVLCLTFLP